MGQVESAAGDAARPSSQVRAEIQQVRTEIQTALGEMVPGRVRALDAGMDDEAEVLTVKFYTK